MISPPITTLVVESDLQRANQIIGLLSQSPARRFNCLPAKSLQEARGVLSRENIEIVVSRFFLPESEAGGSFQSYRSQAPGVLLVALLEDEEKDAALDLAQQVADECLFYKSLVDHHLVDTILIALERREMLSELRLRQASSVNGKGTYRALLNRIDEALFLVSRPEGRLIFSNEVAEAWYPDDKVAILNELFEYGVLEAPAIEMEIATSNPLIPNAELRSVELEWRDEQCCMITLRNISKRKRAEEAYKGSQRRLELALKSSKVGLWSWDLRSNQLQFSERWKQLLGYENHEFENSLAAFREALHPEDRQRAVEAFQTALKAGANEFEIEYRVRSRDGSYRRMLCRAEVFPDGEGKLATLLGTHLDVTERTGSETVAQPPGSDGSKWLSAHLASRMERAVAELEAQASWIRSHFRSDSEIRSSIREMERLSQRVGRLNDILRESGGQNGESEKPLDLGAWLVSSRELLACLVPSKVVFELDTEECVSLAGFGGALLSMTLSEALLAISDQVSSEFKSRLLVRTCRDSGDNSRETAPCLEFVYAGREIDSRELEGIAHVPGIRVYTYASDGLASLKLIFDLGVDASESSRRTKRKPLALLAEDEGVLRMAIAKMLESIGYEVTLAEDGATAVDRFFQNKNGYSIALVDLNMPEIDGDGVFASIRSCKPQLPVIRMSGDEEGWSDRDFEDDAHCRFLSKPFGVAALRRVIQELANNEASSV